MLELSEKFDARKTDILVSEKILSLPVSEVKNLWKTSDFRENYYVTELKASGRNLPEYSSEIQHAMDVVEELNKIGFYLGDLYQMNVSRKEDNRWLANFQYFGEVREDFREYSSIGNCAAEAICLAGLEVVKNE